jgi:acyl-CoA synthetase (AMP-forming)/AMP-acid ligase II/1-acyl-sn-glycerol-3-phosphate acyltransferase/acyl carrier protein
MLQPFRFALWFFARLVLPLRYRLHIKGMDELQNLSGPALIVPSHPAFIDPLLVMMTLWPRLRPRPMLYEANFRNPFLRPIMKLINAVQVPDLDQASVRAREKAQTAIAQVIEGLKAGDNYILWASGKLRRTAIESLGAARSVAEILQAVPEAAVILVRTRGLWGSRFSYAYTGEHPSLVGGMLRGLAYLLSNFVFFMPRRAVEITVHRVDPEKLPERKRDVLNPWLEAWYNEGEPETPKFVPYHFLFGPRTYEFPTQLVREEPDLSRIKPETKKAVNQLLAEFLKRPLTDDEQKPEMTLDRLGLDSLDRMELTLRIEQQFGFSSDQSPTNVGQLEALAEGLIERGPPKPAPPGWFVPTSNQNLVEFLGHSLAESFLLQALANRREVAAADDVSGVLTNERLLVGVLTMARRLAQVPVPNIGLMLPASVAADVAFLALQLAGKLPVMLNWTTGPGHLAHAVSSMKLTHVITARKFLDRSGVNIEGVNYLFMESMRKEAGRWELLRTLLKVRWLPGTIRNRLPKVDPNSNAVILFTSGSEKAPKTVPLTHSNLLSILRAGSPMIGLTSADSMVSFLPPFHSFGVTVGILWPLLGGVRVVHHADPTDASGLARKIASYKPTFVVATPTLLNYIFDRARPGDLQSLRYMIVGAEKAPASLFEKSAKAAPDGLLIEGYGITECSPVVSFNPPGDIRPGTIGKPLPGVAVQVVDLETGKTLGPKEMGMLLVSGPSVFPGYLNHDGPQPFQERDGKRWYVTGDLVEIDSDGYMTFKGRLKRFIKAGGEMISLPALEEPFERLYPLAQNGPRVAVEGVERDGGRRIVLFTTENISVQEANAVLQKEGFRGVMRLDEVRQVKSIPALGTGKTDYKALRRQIADDGK